MKKVSHTSISLGAIDGKEMDGKEIVIQNIQDEPETSDIMNGYFRFRTRIRAIFISLWLLITGALLFYYFNF